MFSSNTSAVSGDANYIEDVFSTYLYTGNGTSQTITNGIDLSTKGGLVWSKRRNVSLSNLLFDTVRGNTKYLVSNTTGAEGTDSPATYLTSFNSNGFSVGAAAATNNLNDTYASWTFRKQPKFFDVVTFTSNSSGGCTFNHSLGASPGFVTIKRTDSTSNWLTYHRSVGNDAVIYLNTTAASASVPGCFTPSSTQFTVQDGVLANSATYVAYLFAHNAGGFGLTGTDNVISCGSYTHNSTSGVDVNLGYEPQWILQKNAGAASGWLLIDNMRGWVVDANDQYLTANSSGFEDNIVNSSPTATGFKVDAGAWGNGANIIYIAIRRGPMKVPTSGTSVYSGVARTGTGAAATVTGVGFSPDLIIGKPRTGFAVGTAQFDRLRGTSVYLAPSWTDAEITDTTMVTSFNMDGVSLGADTVQKYFNGSGGTYANWMFKRAPGFFDEVCYTGTGSARTVAHNLGVAPELMIVKARVSAGGTNRNWAVYASSLGAGTQAWLNTSDAAFASSTIWANTSPTASVFSVSTNVNTNYSGATYVAYLFATCPGVSKVGSYTGNGTTQTINCGFTSGARFILIRKTNDTQSWYVFDSARGIVSGNDPVLLLNTTDSEFTAYDSVDPNSTGFVVNSDLIGLNDSGGNYIFLAIA